MKVNKTTILQAAIKAPVVMSSLLLALGAPAWATHHEQEHGQEAHTHAHETQADAAAVDEFVNAEIRSIDRDNGKLTLKHEAIRKYQMNGMTMGFRADPKQLESLAVGDKVRFIPDRVNGQYVITKIEKLQ